MSNNSLISVIIPTYNGRKFLAATVRSALAQDYPHFEVIVVDDGSPIDDVFQILAPFKNSVKIFKQTNSGPGAARNRGAREAQGEYLAFFDHDDIWSPNKLSMQMAALNKFINCSLVYSHPILIDESGERIPNFPPSVFPEGDVFLEFLRKNRITTFSATLIRKSGYWEIGGIDESLEIMTCDDYDLWLRLTEKFPVSYCPGDLVFYRLHSGNLVKNRILNFTSHINVLEKIKKASSSRNNSTENEIIEKTIDQNLLNWYRRFGMIFYFDYPSSILHARRVLKMTLSISPMDIKLWPYLLLTYPPFSYLRKIRRIFSNVGSF